jgi:hypothetical protein
LAEALRYVSRQLIHLGYTVNLVPPLSLQVTWQKKPEQPRDEISFPEFEFPSLANLRKTAVAYSKSK